MKKSKIFLTVAFVIASVGGALALKSSKFTGSVVCRGLGQHAGPCPSPVGEKDMYRQTVNGTLTRFCNNGSGGVNCNIQRPHLIQDPR